MNANEIRDRGYKVQRQFSDLGTSHASPIARGTRVATIDPAYYGREIAAGSTGTIYELTNAGFRGIEATVRLDVDQKHVVINLGNLLIQGA
jgi:hypothetical protein